MDLAAQLEKLRSRRSRALADAVGRMARLLVAMPGPNPGRAWARAMEDLARHGVSDLLMELVRPNQNLHVRGAQGGPRQGSDVWEALVFLPNPAAPSTAAALAEWTRFWDREAPGVERFNLGKLWGGQSDWMVRGAPRTDNQQVAAPVQIRVWEAPFVQARRLSAQMDRDLPSASPDSPDRDRL